MASTPAPTTSSEVLDPLRLLQEELKEDDYEQVVQSINRLAIVARSLGPDRSRSELLPFLLEFTEQENDEAHAAVARQLGEFLPYVGGPVHGATLLPLLEKLCGEEEVVVREAAVASFVSVVGQFRKDDVVSKFVPLIKRLSANSWFATRVSACGIIAPAYGALDKEKDNEIKQELRNIFGTLCNDETPMVRKQAYQNLGDFAVKIGKPYFKSDILPQLKALATDAMDSMRVLTLDVMGTVSEVLDTTEFEASLLPLIEALEDDTSWRVRQALSKQLPVLCRHVSGTSASTKLIPLFVKLLKDKEAEVRQQGALVLGDIGGGPTDIKGLDTLLGPPLEALAVDPIQTVRVAVAKALIGLCKRFPKEQALKVVIPILKQLTKDDSYEVRSSVLQDIEKLADYIDASALISVVPILTELAKDAKWRVRAAVVDKVAVLARHLGNKKFEKQLQGILISSLSDHVFAIREKASLQVGLVVQIFGAKWAVEKLFPAVVTLYDKTANYLHRMTFLQLASQVGAQSACTGEIIEKHLLPLVLTATSDEVANVRIAAGRTLNVLIPKLDPKLTVSRIHPILKKLITDTDGDVSYFSGLALRAGPAGLTSSPIASKK